MARLRRETSRPKRSDALKNRWRILEAAREVFARRGLDAEVREIAERAGVGIGTLYRHFESREGLLEALLEQTADDLRARLRTALETEEPATVLRTMIRAGAEVWEQFGALIEVLLAGGIEEAAGEAEQFREFLVNLLQRGIREGVFRSDLDIPVAIAILEPIFTSGALHELAAQRSYPGAADAVADFFLAAIEEPKRSEST